MPFLQFLHFRWSSFQFSWGVDDVCHGCRHCHGSVSSQSDRHSDRLTDWPTTSGSVVTRPSPSAVSSWLMPPTTRPIRNGVTASKAWNFSCLDEQLLKGKQCWLSATKSRKPVSCMFFWTWSLLKSNVTAASYSPLLLNDLWGEEWRTPIINSDTHTHISYSRQFLLPEACQEHPD